MKKLKDFLNKVFVFMLTAVFTFLALVMILGSIPEGSFATVSAFAVFILPIVFGLWVTRKIFKGEQIQDSDPEQDLDTDISVLLEKEASTFAVLKEELSCWNWQLVVGGLIMAAGFLRLFLSFFYAIVLIVLGLGILSIGVTKYKEKQELQERELRRKIFAAATKTDCIPKEPEQPTAAAATEKVKTYKVTGVSYYTKNIESLGIENEDYSKSKRELIAEGLTGERIWKYVFYDDSAELEPEPDNPHDPNAIKVIVDGQHVGYIKKGSCAHLLKLIRSQAISRIGCTIGGGPYKYISEEYDDEMDREVYVLGNNATNYFVHLEIHEKSNEP